MDTPMIAAYYKEHEPLKRKKILEKLIQSGEEPEENEIRSQLWNIRYGGKHEAKNEVADGFLRLWMTMEFNKDAGNAFFGSGRARKEIGKVLEELKFKQLLEKGGMYEKLLYRECCHMVAMYIELCNSDKSYTSALGGLISIGKDRLEDKIKKDVYDTGINLPPAIKMENELGMIMKAAKEVYDTYFSEEDGFYI